MNIITIILVWTVIGSVAGRIVFVKVLGDNERHVARGIYNEWSWEMIKAFWTSLFTFLLPPLIIPIIAVFFITKETKSEKIERKKDELKSLEKEVERLRKEFNL